MIRPHEELPQEIARDKSFTRVFLAGTIDMGNSRDWQKEIHRTFSKTGGRYILFNPRQEHWDATRPGEMDYQVRWELDHLEEADMLEMGLHAKGGKTMSGLHANTIMYQCMMTWMIFSRATHLKDSLYGIR